MPDAEVIVGDAIAVMRGMDPGQFQCVVTSGGTHFVELLALLPEGIAPVHVLRGERQVGDPPRGSIGVCEIPVSGDAGAVSATSSLEAAQDENLAGNCPLDSQVRQQRPQDMLGLNIRSGIAKQRPPICRVRFFFVVRASESFRQELNGLFVDHTHLDAGVIPWGNSPLAGIGFGFLDADIAFPVDEASEIRNVRAIHYINLHSEHTRLKHGKA